MIPERFKLRPVSGTRDQLRAVRDLLRDKRFKEVVNACDAGREGELIFRYVYELAGSRLPVRRLWVSSLTDEAIRAGFAGLRAGADFDALGAAARSRSEADWLVGMNATRAVTVSARFASPRPRPAMPQKGRRRHSDSPLYSIGRVQTPTLALVVRRELEIRRFEPRDYWEIRGAFTPPRRGRRDGGGHVARRRARRQGAAQPPRRAPARRRRRRARRGPGRRDGRARPRRRAAAAAAHPRGAAPALRSDVAAAHGQPALRALGNGHARGRPGALRALQDPHVPAYGLAAPHDGPREGAAEDLRGARGRPRIRALRRAAAGDAAHALAPASSTTRRSPITTRSSPRESPSRRASCRATSGGSSIWWRAGSWARFTPTPSSR